MEEKEFYKWSIGVIRDGSLSSGVENAMRSARALGLKNWRKEIKEAARIGWDKNYQEKLKYKGFLSLDYYLEEIRHGELHSIKYPAGAIHLAVRADRVEEFLEAVKIGFPHDAWVGKNDIVHTLLNTTPNKAREIEKKLFSLDVDRYLDSEYARLKRYGLAPLE